MLLIEFKPLIFASCFLFHLNRCKTRPGSNFFAEPWALFTLVSAIPPGQNIRDRKKGFFTWFREKNLATECLYFDSKVEAGSFVYFTDNLEFLRNRSFFLN